MGAISMISPSSNSTRESSSKIPASPSRSYSSTEKRCDAGCALILPACHLSLPLARAPRARLFARAPAQPALPCPPFFHDHTESPPRSAFGQPSGADLCPLCQSRVQHLRRQPFVQAL